MRVGAVQAQVQWFACAWRGWRACSGAYMRTTHHVRHCCAQNADHLAHGSPLSAFFAEVVCSLAATPPPVGSWPTPNGGNGVIRGVTRRRHAASHLLMLQNPHRHWCGRRRRDRGARLRCPWAVAGPGWAIHSDPAPLEWRTLEGREGLAAVPVAVAGPGWAIHSDQAPLVWRAPEGPEGTGGLRGAAPNEVRSPSLAGGRGLRRPEHPWGHKVTQQDTARGPKRRSASGPSRVSVAHRLSWMLRPGTASISSRV